MEFFIRKTKEYFTSMNEIHPEIQENIKQQLHAAAQGNQQAKEILARQLESHFVYNRWTPSASLYPNVPIYLSLIYRTFGQMVLDAVLFQSPFIENVWIFENRPVEYTEHGILKTYPYIPTSEEVEVLQNEVAHLTGGTLHAKRSALSGEIKQNRLRIQMYCPPRSIRTIIVRIPDKGYLTLETMEMDQKIRNLLREIGRSRASIAIAGGMDTGKTTLLRSLILEKDPQTNTLTVIEQVPELGIGEIWGKVVVEKCYVEEEPFEVMYGHSFRNSTRSLAVGEMRYPFEAHYVTESALRAPGFTFTSLHLKVVSPKDAMRTFESLVYQYRKSDREGIRQDIAGGLDLFIMLEKDYHSGKRYVSSVFCPYLNDKNQLDAKHLVYRDKNGNYVWTGEKIPAEKRGLFESEPDVNIDALQQLGVW